MEQATEVDGTEAWFEEVKWLQSESESSVCRLLEDEYSGTSDSQFQWSIILEVLLFFRNGLQIHVQNACKRAQDWKAANSSDRYSTEISSALQTMGMTLAKIAVKEAPIAIQRYATLHDEIQQNNPTGPLTEIDFANKLQALTAAMAVYCERSNSSLTLDNCISCAEKICNGLPENYFGLPWIQNSLATMLLFRFERQGRGLYADIDRCIELLETILDTCTGNKDLEAGCWSNLGAAYSQRHQFSKSPEDQNNAIYACEKSISRPPTKDDGRHSQHFSNLSVLYSDRYYQSNEITDISLAIVTSGKALTSLEQSPGDSSFLRGIILNNMGNFYRERYLKSRTVEDFHHSLKAAKEAMDSAEGNHLYKAGFCANYSKILEQNEQISKADAQTETIDESIKAAKQALALEAKDHPHQASYQNILAGLLCKRYRHTSDLGDIRAAIGAYIEGYRCANASPWIRAWMARKAAELLYIVDRTNLDAPSHLLEHAVKLLPNVSPRSMRHGDQQSVIGDFSGLGADAAALMLRQSQENDAYRALQVLELGRDIMAGLLLDMRVDLSTLRADAEHKKLAGEIDTLMEQLASFTVTREEAMSSAEPASGSSQPTWKRRKALEELESHFKQVRNITKYRSFLEAPLGAELIELASSEPMAIINVSKYGSNAFLIKGPKDYCPGRIWTIPLPGLTLIEVEAQILRLRLYIEKPVASRGMQRMLEWQWDNLAEPVLEELGLKEPCVGENAQEWPRLRWITCGRLVQLPIHASGYHFDSSRRTVLDRAMSVYSSSVKTLLYAHRSPLIPTNTKSESQNALVVSIENTDLRFVPDELNHLAAFLQAVKMNLSPVIRRQDVLAGLKNSCNIFHFAGHGISDEVDPSQSALLLKDERLSVADLRDSRLHESQPFLAYLSACSTSENRNDKLVDEAIHLVGACQMAGFRHCIGTLWEVYDECCAEVARIVYKTLELDDMTDTAVCWGLHKAVRFLRDQKVTDLRKRNTTSMKKKSGNEQLDVDDLFVWAPYIHFGV